MRRRLGWLLVVALLLLWGGGVTWAQFVSPGERGRVANFGKLRLGGKNKTLLAETALIQAAAGGL